MPLVEGAFLDSAVRTDRIPEPFAMESPVHPEAPFDRAPSRVLRPVLFALVLLGAAAVGLVVASAVTAAPAGALIRGIDVASWQHPGTGASCGQAINWGQVRDSGVGFAYAKATESTTYTNPCFAQDWAGIAGAGLLRGAYHYARPALPISTAVDQARYFVSKAGSMTGPGDLPGMLDLEETGGLNGTDLSNWTRAFLSEVTLLTGKKPVLYMGAYFFPGAIAADISANYRLWIPSYVCQYNDGTRIPGCDPATKQPRLPTGWSTWTFWQYSSIEPVPGIVGNVDMNWFCCDQGTLNSLAGAGSGAGSPFGVVDQISFTSPTTARVSGWAIDPDTTDAIQIHTWVDSAVTGGSANVPRGDIGAAFPGFGAAHGFDFTVDVPPDAQNICVYAINVGSGANVQMKCMRLGLPAGPPFGFLDTVNARVGAIDVVGWAIDPDTSAPLNVHVYVDSASQAFTAADPRADLGAAYPRYGANHGFHGTVAASPGTHTVCAFAINVGPGNHSLLGCRVVDVPAVVSRAPIGFIDSIVPVAGGAVMSGWTVDPDSSDPTVMLYLANGQFSLGTANVPRADIGSAFGLGANHGFSQRFDLPQGTTVVCAAAIDTGGGSNHTILGCRSVTVAGSSPIGSIDTAVSAYGRIGVGGWALDPDTNDPIWVHVYVNGVSRGFVADGDRPDVGAVFGRGSAHGYSAIVDRVGTGAQNVCVWAINVGPGANSLLGCRTVP